MAARETENNAYAKFCGDKRRTLWYVMLFSGFWSGQFQPVGITFYPPKPHRSRGTEIEFWTPCDMLYQGKMPTIF